ncbi:AmmeMemoRadiSam system protein B [candidate division KSB3 bacterium]|uniref:AmmeMemoRadiSam system protein B n=1 Tax=candidate division KSB3 bacterium TaxID=2044937 RepID=A0A2G6E6S7_9BACT|nr:MAG: AmmeMemoRadiSam system protein B [candidate division KSB3 bacterium]PIE30218.1 MAG: AmmeMemoRadiSam system protein B [candidate division KSB3 bacterium]
MSTRKACRAGSFYPADEASCRRELQRCFGDYHAPDLPGSIRGGIVPHAGWIFSGSTAAKVFKSIHEKSAPESFLIFGAVHVRGVGRKASFFDRGSWETPCGTVPIDEELARMITENASDIVQADHHSHHDEHSIEVQLPFIQYLFPAAKILPIMVHPTEEAVSLGQRIATLLQNQQKQVCVLGSTDLTHYGPRFGFTPYGIGQHSLRLMKANDRKLLDLIVAMKAEHVIRETEIHRNACGAGAIAATIAAVKILGAERGHLLEHITSQDVIPDRPASDFVGYAGIVF